MVCNANLPRPARLVSLQAEKTVGNVSTESPSGSGASGTARSRLPNRPGGCWDVLPEAEGRRKVLTSAVDDQQVTRRGLFGAFVVALEPSGEQRKRGEERGIKEHHGTGRGMQMGAGSITADQGPFLHPGR